jgi:hypothetical protein
MHAEYGWSKEDDLTAETTGDWCLIQIAIFTDSTGTTFVYRDDSLSNERKRRKFRHSMNVSPSKIFSSASLAIPSPSALESSGVSLLP